ncbi:MAG: HSP90 family protein [Chitinophagaceae bacterium]
MKNYNFQVNLGGIIDILANHLYSEQSVFIRELFQNATDAITARQKKEPGFKPVIELEVSNFTDSPSKMMISDNGIGLTEDEVHQFLSIIGTSSKKDELLKKREDFIGQFGIGLLSCFVAADEIVLITKSITGGKPIEWIGKSDGTYTIRELDSSFEPGTRVFLTAKKDMESFFEKEKLQELIIRYANFLPYTIYLTDNGRKPFIINESKFPWETEYENEEDKKEALLAFAESFFEEKFIDCIPLRAEASATQGYAFISYRSNTSFQQQQHTVYLHRMFVSDKASNVLPDWLFFAKCIVNSKGLRPTASRETFYEDEVLQTTREQLGNSIIDYFYTLKEKDPRLLEDIIARHHTAIKLAAINNETFFRHIHGFVTFETNYKTKTLQELLKSNETIRYVTDLDEFRKIAGVAANQSLEIVNAGYVYEASFFEMLTDLYPEYDIEGFDVEELILQLTEPELEEREAFLDFLNLADAVLQQFGCVAELRKFLPHNMPAIYFKNEEMDFIRNIKKSKDVADELWGGILDNISQDAAREAHACVCFNFNNPLVQKAALMKDKEALTVLIKMLYVQSLLLGRHSLQQSELSLLTGGLHYFMDKITAQHG